MKKSILSFGLFVLLLVSSAFAAPYDDYVYKVSDNGDTLFVKDYLDMDEPSTLLNCIKSDSLDVPSGRVYVLKANGYYPLGEQLNTERKIIIQGEDETRLVVNDNAMSIPPLICGFSSEGTDFSGAIYFLDDLTIKNVSIVPGTATGVLGWSFFNANGEGNWLTIENSMFEHTKWVFMNTEKDHFKAHISDCYFVNMNGHPCRRNGGVMDQFGLADTLIVENSTHVMAQGMVYKFRGYPFEKVIFNHNTFVNVSNTFMETFGYQSNMSVTNNIFVNCNIQPYRVGFDADETDQDGLPMGLINVRPLPDSGYTIVPRKILVEKNLAFWSSTLSDVESTVEANAPQGVSEWYSQMITMNTRTQDMFDNNAVYPFLVEEDWYDEEPNFTDPQDLLTTQLANIKEFSIATVDTNSTDELATWRVNSLNGEMGQENFIYSDWPIPVDLSYDNTTLLTAGIGNYPLGDLNWFPSQKESWSAQSATEYEVIEYALQNGITDVDDEVGSVPSEFELKQNYPNPFNPTTTISFAIPEAGNVTLKVYNALGQEVATLMNDFKTANTYKVNFNASNLASGVYIYSLQYGNHSLTKKMMLLK